ncbi:MAG TPA: hypothetical protein VFN20_09820 [Candidatus Acidoferrum sp.]|nr:hypothetical protein [Candidatus Acidoferrum sp.]
MPVVSRDVAVAYGLGAAQVLGIGRTSLYRYLKQDGLRRSSEGSIRAERALSESRRDTK